MITATNIIGSILVLVLGGVFMQIRNNGKKLETSLYQKDGITIYIPRTECQTTHDSICKKVDEIKSIVEKGDEKRQEARKENSAKWESLQHTLGRVEEYIRTHQ